MNVQSVLNFLAPFVKFLDPALLTLEEVAKTELLNVIQTVESPDLKSLLTELLNAIDTWGKQEINKL